MAKLTVQDVINAVGKDTINDLYQQTGNRYFGDAVEKYIQEKLSVANYLGLYDTTGKTLIDIGTGAGWFPYICKLYGHHCVGTETINTETFKETYIPIYEHLNLDICDALVHAKTPFKLDIQVDYIVTLRSFFPNRPRIWEVDDWKYFFKDIIKNLNPNGGLYLGCNKGQRKQYINSPCHWGPTDVCTMFADYHVPASKDLKIKSNTVYLPYKVVKELGEK